MPQHALDFFPCLLLQCGYEAIRGGVIAGKGEMVSGNTLFRRRNDFFFSAFVYWDRLDGRALITPIKDSRRKSCKNWPPVS